MTFNFKRIHAYGFSALNYCTMFLRIKHITPVMKNLHELKILDKITYKILMFIYLIF